MLKARFALKAGSQPFFSVVFLLGLLLLGSVSGYGQTKSPLPSPTGYVDDYANIIDSGTKTRMETILTNLKERANVEFAVVTVPTTNGQPIFDYSLAVARGWGIGSSEGEKDGVLLLTAINDRTYQIQISRHLEGDLPDGLVGDIGRRMRDQFRTGNYSQGLMTAVQTFIATLSQARGFSIDGIDQSYAYKASSQPSSSAKGSSGILALCVPVIVIIIIMGMISERGRGGSGCLNLLLLNSLFNLFSSGRGSSGGGGGGWSGGGGGGFGGFGGGGDFGGGGAGGSW